MGFTGRLLPIFFVVVGCGQDAAPEREVREPSPAREPIERVAPARAAPALTSTPTSALAAAEASRYRRELTALFGPGDRPVERVLHGGTEMLRVPGGSAVTVAQVGADGRVSTHCADDVEGALSGLSGKHPHLATE